MKSFQTMTWALLALSISLAQPALARDHGGGDAGRDIPTNERGASDRGEATPFDAPRRVASENTHAAGSPISREELELTCGAAGWIETWLEDADGNPIDGTYEYACMD